MCVIVGGGDEGVEHLQGYSCRHAQMDTSCLPLIVTSFATMLEYSDAPACSHSPYASSYSILAGKLCTVPPEGFSLLPSKGPTLCMHIQDVV